MAEISEEDLKAVAGIIRRDYGKKNLREVMSEFLDAKPPPEEENETPPPPKKETEGDPPPEEETKKKGLWWV